MACPWKIFVALVLLAVSTITHGGTSIAAAPISTPVAGAGVVTFASIGLLCALVCAGSMSPAAAAAAPACAACWDYNLALMYPGLSVTWQAVVCFDVTTNVETPAGHVLLSDLHAGDDVITLDSSGRKVITVVDALEHVTGNFSFTSVELDQGNHRLVVTDNHQMMTLHDGTFSLFPAKSLQLGQVVPLGGSSNGTVTRVGQVHRSSLLSLATRDCTILANDVHTTTQCQHGVRTQDLARHIAKEEVVAANENDFVAEDLRSSLSV